MKTRWFGVTALIGTVLGAALLAAPAWALGDKELTPLGKWMKPNVGAPMAGQEYATVAASMRVVAGRVPSGNYGNWASLSTQAAAAAAKGDLNAIKAACKGCHDAYKTQYRSEHPGDAYP